MKHVVIVVAGGKGLRMGGDLPKQFQSVGGQPVLMRTLNRFAAAMPDAELILVLPEAHFDFWKSLCATHHFGLPHQLVAGGATRFHSVKNALAKVEADADTIVGVHDGVRPFVSPQVIERCFEAAKTHGAVVPAVAPVETVRMGSTESSHTVDRSACWLVQTPQTFRADWLKQAYAQPYVTAFTDDASVVESMGKSVIIVEGNRENIKLTTPSDLHFAEMLCNRSL